MQEKLKAQQLARQKILNLSRAHEDEQYHLMELERIRGHVDTADCSSWEAEADAIVAAATTGSESPASPSVAALTARIRAVRSRAEEMRKAEAALRARSHEAELKLQRLVALATKSSEAEVDGHLEGLVRAVESEKGELDIGRIRRFLSGVEGVVH